MKRSLRSVFAAQILLLTLWLPAAAQETGGLTLEDLWGMALARAERIAIAGENVVIAERGKDRAVSALLPTATAFWGITQYNGRKTSAGVLIQPDHVVNWGVRLDETLSLGGREFHNLNAASSSSEARRYDYAAFREDYLFSVAASYFDVFRFERSVEIARSNVERLAKHRDAAKTRLKIGEVTKTAVLRAEAELSGASSDLIRAENNHALARAGLARLTGVSGDYKLRPHPEGGPAGGPETLVPGCDAYSLPCLQDRALVERHEMKSAGLAIEAARSQKSAAKANYLPNLALEAVYSRNEQDPETVLVNKESVFGGVKVVFPFFEGGLRRAEVGEAEARLRQAELGREDLRRSISLEMEQAYRDMMTQRGVLASLADQVAFARDNFNATSRQFEFGLATSIDVMDANNILVTAERQHADARFLYELSQLRVRRAAGLLLQGVSPSGDPKS